MTRSIAQLQGFQGTATSPGRHPRGQILLVLQGRGAIGAYRVRVYQALDKAGIETQWGNDTSIGAINGKLARKA